MYVRLGLLNDESPPFTYLIEIDRSQGRITGHDVVLCPTHRENHWYLVVLFPKIRYCYSDDSIESDGSDAASVRAIYQDLVELDEGKVNATSDLSERWNWTSDHIQACLQSPNSSKQGIVVRFVLSSTNFSHSIYR